MNILVVEDDSTSLKLVTLVLQQSQHQTETVSSAEEALALVKANPPDAILLDLKLPGMGGLELANELQSDPVTASIPLIAMTAYPLAFAKEECLRAGCDAYILKPISTRTLSSEIEMACNHDTQTRLSQ
jgi:two-component system cell cycle response regulator